MVQNSDIKHIFFYIATFIIIISGIKLASQVVIILFLAIFIASIFQALLEFLNKLHFSKILSFFIVGIIFIVIFYLLFYLISNSIGKFIANLPQYEQNLKLITLGALDFLHGYNIIVEKNEVLKLLNFSAIFGVTTNIIGNLGSILSKFLLIFIGVAFILSESASLDRKIQTISKNNPKRLESFKLFTHNIQRYFLAKTLTSFLTGFFIFIILILFDVEYPLLWAFLAFLFNFIPVVGSIVASIPPIMLLIFKADFTSALYITILYIIINISISNIIEPKYMGDELGLSPSVIFFSLIFWGYILGIAGMFLAIPITMTIKIASQSNEDSHWVGDLMSK